MLPEGLITLTRENEQPTIKELWNNEFLNNNTRTFQLSLCVHSCCNILLQLQHFILHRNCATFSANATKNNSPNNACACTYIYLYIYNDNGEWQMSCWLGMTNRKCCILHTNRHSAVVATGCFVAACNQCVHMFCHQRDIFVDFFLQQSNKQSINKQTRVSIR